MLVLCISWGNNSANLCSTPPSDGVIITITALNSSLNAYFNVLYTLHISMCSTPTAADKDACVTRILFPGVFALWRYTTHFDIDM